LLVSGFGASIRGAKTGAMRTAETPKARLARTIAAFATLPNPPDLKRLRRALMNLICAPVAQVADGRSEARRVRRLSARGECSKLDRQS
jgi:hypothetical protein